MTMGGAISHILMAFNYLDGDPSTLDEDPRTGDWEFHILNVASAVQVSVPDASIMFLLGPGLVGLGLLGRRKLVK